MLHVMIVQSFDSVRFIVPEKSVPKCEKKNIYIYAKGKLI